MMFADSKCEVIEDYKPGHKPEHTYTFKGTCIVTKKPYSVTVPGNELFRYRQGAYIQDALVSVSAEDREFLMTGISPEGWAKMFPEQ